MIPVGPVVVRAQIAATRDSVWAALVQQSWYADLKFARELFGEATISGSREASGKVDVWVPGHVLGFKWAGEGEKPTAVLVTLRSRGDSTDLTLTETGFDALENGAQVAAAAQLGWDAAFARLAETDFAAALAGDSPVDEDSRVDEEAPAADAAAADAVADAVADAAPADEDADGTDDAPADEIASVAEVEAEPADAETEPADDETEDEPADVEPAEVELAEAEPAEAEPADSAVEPADADVDAEPIEPIEQVESVEPIEPSVTAEPVESAAAPEAEDSAEKEIAEKEIAEEQVNTEPQASADGWDNAEVPASAEQPGSAEELSSDTNPIPVVDPLLLPQPPADWQEDKDPSISEHPSSGAATPEAAAVAVYNTQAGSAVADPVEEDYDDGDELEEDGFAVFDQLLAGDPEEDELAEQAGGNAGRHRAKSPQRTTAGIYDDAETKDAKKRWWQR